LVPEALEKAVGKLGELSPKGIDIVYFDRMDFERKQRSGFGISQEGYIQYEDILCERVHGDFWVVMRRDLIEADDRFDERLWGNESYLWLKLLRKTKAYYVPRVLYVNYRQHGGQRISHSGDRLEYLPRSTLTNKFFLEQHGAELRKMCPKLYGRKLAVVGASQILIGEKSEGRKAIRESLQYGISIYCLLVFLLSFILASGQIKSLASNYIRIRNR
jgi:hypothetical protein